MVENDDPERLQIKYPEFAGRLQQAMKHAEVSVTDIKTRVGVSYEMARRYAIGAAMPRPGKLETLAHLVGKTAQFLVYGETAMAASDDRKSSDLPAIHERREVSPRPDIFEISAYDVYGSMGRGIPTPERVDVIERMTVSATWLRSQVAFTSPSNLGIITGYGDSMEGTFNDGDPLLIDLGVNEIKIDAVYVLALNEELYIKRLQRRPDGTIVMISDNKKYDPYVIKSEELHKFQVLGRVLLAWNARKL